MYFCAFVSDKTLPAKVKQLFIYLAFLQVWLDVSVHAI